MEEKEMTLGQRITAYRTKARLSQDSLAELLEVSRQSVSKWETDASVPELNKLVRLSQVFGVSLDELVKGEPAGKAADADRDTVPESQTVYIPASQDAEAVAETLRSHRQKIAGIVLLTVCGVACFLQIGLIMLIWPLLVIGLLCLITKRVTGLGVGWLLWLAAAAMCYGYTSVNLFMVFHPEVYRIMPVQVVIAWSLWGLLAVLAIVTARRFRTGEADLPEWPVVGVMAAVWIVMTAGYWYMFGLHFFGNALSHLFAIVLGLLVLAKLWQKKPKEDE